MIALSIVIGLAAVVIASRWIRRHGPLATTKVVVAASDIELGSRLSANQVRAVDWPLHTVPSGAFTEAGAVDGRIVSTSMLRGEPVLASKLAPLGSKAGLASLIGEGRRAITVRVNDVVGVAGFALPGNYVDIVVNAEDDPLPDGSSRGRSMSRIVLERILVLAVAQVASRDETKPKVVNAVTLEVSPEQAEIIDLARSVGNLSLVLRNQVDTSVAATTGVTKFELLHPGEVPLDVQTATSTVAAPVVVQPAAPAPPPVPDAPPPALPKAQPPARPRHVPQSPQPARDAGAHAAPQRVEVEVIKGGKRTQEGF
jgi:pilus assembly protein CpaB